MMLRTEIPVILDGCMDSIEVNVEYKYIPGCKGSCNSMGVPEEPDTPDDLEIESIVDDEGIDWTNLVTKAQMQDLITQCMRDMADNQ